MHATSLPGRRHLTYCVRLNTLGSTYVSLKESSVHEISVGTGFNCGSIIIPRSTNLIFSSSLHCMPYDLHNESSRGKCCEFLQSQFQLSILN